ncbi:hypothetical protein BY996DRAFT_8552264 [Phakopsora pachyrhizi]|nr:hypothetical protein BY996DRAFT_8552264 [Phakopsora pachyrhizi]
MQDVVVNLKFEQNLDGNDLIAASSVIGENVAKGSTSNKVPERVTHSHDQWCGSIDPTFLEASPDDTRREVSNIHIREQRPAREELSAPVPSSISTDSLMPFRLRYKQKLYVLKWLRGRREEELERRNTTSGSATRALSGSEDLDTATFFASLDPTLS